MAVNSERAIAPGLLVEETVTSRILRRVHDATTDTVLLGEGRAELPIRTGEMPSPTRVEFQPLLEATLRESPEGATMRLLRHDSG